MFHYGPVEYFAQKARFAIEDLNANSPTGTFKKVIQPCLEPCRRKGRSDFEARSVLPVCEHRKIVSTPLVGFSTFPLA